MQTCRLVTLDYNLDLYRLYRRKNINIVCKRWLKTIFFKYVFFNLFIYVLLKLHRDLPVLRKECVVGSAKVYLQSSLSDFDNIYVDNYTFKHRNLRNHYPNKKITHPNFYDQNEFPREMVQCSIVKSRAM